MLAASFGVRAMYWACLSSPFVGRAQRCHVCQPAARCSRYLILHDTYVHRPAHAPCHPCPQAYTSSNSGDWRRYAMFNDIHYVRNLVDANEDFELIVSGPPGAACGMRRTAAVGCRQWLSACACTVPFKVLLPRAGRGSWLGACSVRT